MSTNKKKPRSKPGRTASPQQKAKRKVAQPLSSTEVDLDNDAYFGLESDALQPTETRASAKATTPRSRSTAAQPIAGASGAVPVEPEQTFRINLGSVAHVVTIVTAIGSGLVVLLLIYKWCFTIDSKVEALADADREKKVQIQVLDAKGTETASAIMVIKHDIDQIKADVSKVQERQK